MLIGGAWYNFKYMMQKNVYRLTFLVMVVGTVAIFHEPLADFFFKGHNLFNEPLRQESEQSEALSTAGVLAETNHYRATENATALRSNDLLTQAAEAKLNDMFEHQYFAHLAPDGKGPADWADKVGYEYIVIAENLALGSYQGDAGLVKAWMDSPGHRANIMSKQYTEIGIAVKQGIYEGALTWLAVQEFGTPVSACGPVNESRQTVIDFNKQQLKVWDAQLKQKQADIKKLPPNSPEYTAQAAAYNQLVHDYNELSNRTKKLVTDYNTEVQQYNTCVRQYKEEEN